MNEFLLAGMQNAGQQLSAFHFQRIAPTFSSGTGCCVSPGCKYFFGVGCNVFIGLSGYPPGIGIIVSVPPPINPNDLLSSD